MADHPDPHPEFATLRRSKTVCKLIHDIFAVIYSHLSQLSGRTIRQYSEYVNISFIKKYFSDDEKFKIENNSDVAEFETFLLHKLLKTCCGLAHPSDEVWKSSQKADTIEFLITYCWTENKALLNAREMNDSTLRDHIDKVLQALLLLVQKVEEQKGVDESALKSELTKHITQKFLYDNDPVSYHIYSILSSHALHRMLIIVYQQLNNLKGMTLSKFLEYRKINLTSGTLYSNEHRFLEQNPPPENMSISILHRVLLRVCFGFNPYKKGREISELEETLNTLMQKYKIPPESEEECTRKSSEIYSLLTIALTLVIEQKEGKSIHAIIRDLPREPYVVKSFCKPLEFTTCSLQCVSTTPLNPESSSSESSGLSTNSSVSPLRSPSEAIGKALATASSSGDLSVEEWNVALLFKVMCPGGMATQTLALVFKVLQGNMDAVSRKRFTSPEKDKITSYEGGKNIDELAKEDVTFLCKLLRHGCASLSKDDDDWVKPKYTAEYFINLIRNRRNTLSHDLSTIKTSVLTSLLTVTKDYLKTLLELTQQILSANVSEKKELLEDLRKKMESEIDTIANSTPDTSYSWALGKMTETMTRKIIQTAREELQEMPLSREDLRHMPPLRNIDESLPPLTIQDVYVDRKLEDPSDSEAVRNYCMEDVLFGQCGNPPPRVTVIHGRPGEGKTSLCKHAFHLWSENVVASSLKEVDLYIYINCRFVTTKSIKAYLRERLPKTFKDIDKDDIIPLMQEPKVVFVADEPGLEAMSLINDILTSLPDARMIITTKTSWLPKIIQNVKAITSYFQVLRMMELTDENRQDLITKLFRALGKGPNTCEEFFKFLNNVKEKLYDLISCPLTYCFLGILWAEKPKIAEEIQTITQLYHKVYDLILFRESEKLGKSSSDFEKLMITLGEIAWENLNNDLHHLTRMNMRTLQGKAEGLGLGEKDNEYLLSILLHCDEVGNVLGGDGRTWFFKHINQQEYFCAEYIVDLLCKDRNLALTEKLGLPTKADEEYKKKMEKLLPLIEFVCGLLEIYKMRKDVTEAVAKEVAQIMSMTEPWAFAALPKIFKPLLKQSGVEQIVKDLFQNEVMSTLENYDPQSVLWVLKHTSLTVSDNLTIIAIESELEHMNPLLKYLKSKQKSVKIMLDVLKVRDIPGLVGFTKDMEHTDVVFAFMPWKPVCIARLVEDWPWPRPLRLHLRPWVLHLLWWELLICLLHIRYKVHITKIGYSPSNPMHKELEQGAVWLKAETDSDSSLAPSELLITCHKYNDKAQEA